MKSCLVEKVIVTISLSSTNELNGDVGSKSSDGVNYAADDVESRSDDTLGTCDAVDIQHILSHNHHTTLYLVTPASDDSEHLA